MDNFFDRITNRFSGHDAIKANSEAEAAEMRKLKSQAEQAQKVLAQYDNCMQEMRKLNLRNTESAKAVRELIENAQTVLNSMKDLELSGKEERSEEIVAIINEKSTALSEKMAAFTDKMTDTDENVSALADMLVNRDKKIAALADQLKDIEGKIAALPEQMTEDDSKITELAEKMADIDGKIAIISEKTAAADEKLTGILNADSSLKADLENAVHKENVKVYRNVQASLMEEMSKQTDTLKEDLQRLNGLSKPLLILVIISLVVGLGSLGIMIVQMLGFF